MAQDTEAQGRLKSAPGGRREAGRGAPTPARGTDRAAASRDAAGPFLLSAAPAGHVTCNFTCSLSCPLVSQAEPPQAGRCVCFPASGKGGRPARDAEWEKRRPREFQLRQTCLLLSESALASQPLGRSQQSPGSGPNDRGGERPPALAREWTCSLQAPVYLRDLVGGREETHAG